MKLRITVLTLLISSLIHSQNKKSSFVEYMNMSSLSISKNTESYFNDYRIDEERATDGFGFDLNTIHGAKFFGYVSLSAGFGIDWNINKTFLSTPIIFDVRVFSSKTAENPLFLYLQTGPNIRWPDSLGSNGTSSKFGAGVAFKFDNNVSYYVDIFRKSKVIDIPDKSHTGNYNITGYGISLGIQF